MTFVMIFTYKLVSQVVLQHSVAVAATCVGALPYMWFSYMPTNSYIALWPQACEYHYKGHEPCKVL